jgi:hypothetical protein
VLALVGLWTARKQLAWRPVLVLTVIALVLTLGMTLKWDNESIRLAAIRPLNEVLWRIGHGLKPGFFVTAQPPPPFDTAIPLPGLLATMVVPFLERARVFARFALVGAVGVYLLAALGLTLVRPKWARLALISLLMVEVLPRPLERLPFPPQPHPAFEWLKGQSLPGQSIVDVVAAHPYTPVLLNEGQTVLATLYHGKPTVSGASSPWPADNMFLFQWLATHQHAFWSPDLAPILRFFSVRYVLLHLAGEYGQGLLDDAKTNPELDLVECFPAVPGPWNYPICVLEVLPPANPNLNLVPNEGWSGQEDWGMWAEGLESDAFWVATAKRDHRLHIEAFPICVDAPNRRTDVEVNGTVIATHEWVGCDPWSADLVVPASVVRLGQNTLVVRSSHAARPSELNPGQSDDTRLLSAGFSQLRIELLPPPEP